MHHAPHFHVENENDWEIVVRAMITISDAQGAALETLALIVDPTTYVGGGVAVALRLAHRHSRDLDLFVPVADPVAMAAAFERPGIRILTRAESDLRAWVRRL